MCGGCSTSIDWLGVSILDAMMEDGGDSDGVSMKVYVVSLLSTYLLAKREEVTITYGTHTHGRGSVPAVGSRLSLTGPLSLERGWELELRRGSNAAFPNGQLAGGS